MRLNVPSCCNQSRLLQETRPRSNHHKVASFGLNQINYVEKTNVLILCRTLIDLFCFVQGHSEVGGFWAGSSKDTIRAIQSKAHAISAVFVKLCK